MNKKTLTYIGIGAVVLVGGYLAYKKFFKDDKPSMDAEVEPEVKMGKPNEAPIIDQKAIIQESASVLETSTKKKGLFGEKIESGIDPRIDQAMANREEANRIRKAKGVRDVRWIAEMVGQKLSARQQAFMLSKQSNASSDEKLSASVTMLNWAKSR
jgi:hypothetical protein